MNPALSSCSLGKLVNIAAMLVLCCITGEKLWRMPVEDSYWDIMKSPIADMKVSRSMHPLHKLQYVPQIRWTCDSITLPDAMCKTPRLGLRADAAVSAVQNAGNKYAGSITAALFLQQYVDTEKVQWAHIDIAGCDHSPCATMPKCTSEEWESIDQSNDSIAYWVRRLLSAFSIRAVGCLPCSTAWDDKLGGATGYGAALLAQWAILEGQS
jgi:Cytosol aminopeptidase family, catalytic domain